MPRSRSSGELRAPLGDQMILVVRRRHNPCFRLACMNSSSVAVEHRRGVADLDAGAQILDARLIEHVAADLIAPAHVGLRVLEHLRGGVALVELELVELRLQHLHGGRAVLVLAALALAGDHDAARHVRDAHRRFGLVHVLTAGAARAVDIGAQVRRIDLDVDVVVDLGRDEHRSERGVAAIARVERRLAHQPVHAGLGAQPAVGIIARACSTVAPLMPATSPSL